MAAADQMSIEAAEKLTVGDAPGASPMSNPRAGAPVLMEYLDVWVYPVGLVFQVVNISTTIWPTSEDTDSAGRTARSIASHHRPDASDFVVTDGVALEHRGTAATDRQCDGRWVQQSKERRPHKEATRSDRLARFTDERDGRRSHLGRHSGGRHIALRRNRNNQTVSSDVVSPAATCGDGGCARPHGNVGNGLLTCSQHHVSSREHSVISFLGRHCGHQLAQSPAGRLPTPRSAARARPRGAAPSATPANSPREPQSPSRHPPRTPPRRLTRHRIDAATTMADMTSREHLRAALERRRMAMPTTAMRTGNRDAAAEL